MGFDEKRGFQNIRALPKKSKIEKKLNHQFFFSEIRLIPRNSEKILFSLLFNFRSLRFFFFFFRIIFFFFLIFKHEQKKANQGTFFTAIKKKTPKKFFLRKSQ